MNWIDGPRCKRKCKHWESRKVRRKFVIRVGFGEIVQIYVEGRFWGYSDKKSTISKAEIKIEKHEKSMVSNINKIMKSYCVFLSNSSNSLSLTSVCKLFFSSILTNFGTTSYLSHFPPKVIQTKCPKVLILSNSFIALFKSLPLSWSMQPWLIIATCQVTTGFQWWSLVGHYVAIIVLLVAYYYAIILPQLCHYVAA